MGCVLSLLVCSACGSGSPARTSSGSADGSTTKIEFGEGFFEPEQNGGTWRWMGPDGRLKITNTHRSMTLKIQGRAPEGLAESPTIRFEFNGRPLDQVVGLQPIDKQYAISAAAQGDGEMSELRISTDRTVVPHDVNPSSPDRRRLGFSVYSVTWSAQQGGAP
jgi:hypothetical protein